MATIKKYGGNPATDLPPYDPFDELTFAQETNAKERFCQELKSLKSLNFQNELQNIRVLIRTQSLVDTQKELSLMNKIKVCAHSLQSGTGSIGRERETVTVHCLSRAFLSEIKWFAVCPLPMSLRQLFPHSVACRSGLEVGESRWRLQGHSAGHSAVASRRGHQCGERGGGAVGPRAVWKLQVQLPRRI